MRIYFVTSSRSKLDEMEQILKTKLIIALLYLHEIQAVNVREVVKDKAKRAYLVLKKPLIVEDTGLYIRALNGFPGALVKWLLSSIGNEGICKILEGFEDRSAYAETCICFYDGKRSVVFSGKVEGMLVRKPRGSSGFGWDPIFRPKSHDKTFGEMSTAEKNELSMRAEAALKLKRYLEFLDG